MCVTNRGWQMWIRVRQTMARSLERREVCQCQRRIPWGMRCVEEFGLPHGNINDFRSSISSSTLWLWGTYQVGKHMNRKTELFRKAQKGENDRSHDKWGDWHESPCFHVQSVANKRLIGCIHWTQSQRGITKPRESLYVGLCRTLYYFSMTHENIPEMNSLNTLP